MVNINQCGTKEMIFESVICTQRPSGEAHLTPLGYRLNNEKIILAPYVPSNTLDNLRANGIATLNFTDDVRVYAGCLTGRREWPLTNAKRIKGQRLRDALAHVELVVEKERTDEERPQFVCRVDHQENHDMFRGFNRAQAAVIEACILATRLDWLSVEKVSGEMRYLSIAIDKTAGARERCAWQWIVEKIDAHPNYQGFREQMTRVKR